ncbi:hypothetical protein BJ742DRAFT_827148 [Cladochytrium replicatum]|nr:hypothetical protein BJ742DRAFT_827148 [Cladochytrium replicatum]
MARILQSPINATFNHVSTDIPQLQLQFQFPISHMEFLEPYDCCGYFDYFGWLPRIVDDESERDPIARDATRLIRALGGITPRTSVITEVLSRNSHSDLLLIQEKFYEKTKRHLTEAFASHKGAYWSLAKALVTPLENVEAVALHKAFEGWGFDLPTICELLLGRPTEDVVKLRTTYNNLYGRDIMADVKDEAGGNFENILLASLEGKRGPDTGVVNQAAVDDDIELLYAASEGRFGADPEMFIEVLTLRSESHLRKLFADYPLKSKNKTDIISVMKSEFMGKFETACVTVTQAIDDHPHYVALLYQRAIGGWGRHDDLLIRLAVRYRDPALRAKVKQAYQKYTGDSLMDRLASKTTHEWEFKRLLLALLSH